MSVNTVHRGDIGQSSVHVNFDRVQTLVKGGTSVTNPCVDSLSLCLSLFGCLFTLNTHRFKVRQTRYIVKLRSNGMVPLIRNNQIRLIILSTFFHGSRCFYYIVAGPRRVKTHLSSVIVC